MLFETIGQDIRLGLRTFIKTPGFTLVAVLTLSLGIGASSWLFNILRQWVIDAVAFPRPDGLVVLWSKDVKTGRTAPVSAADYLDWQEQAQVFEHLAAWTPRQFNLTGAETPQRIAGAQVSADFFRVLGAHPAIGRDFLPEEDKPSAPHAVIIGVGLWHDRYNSDLAVLGRAIELDGVSYAIVGVMPEEFQFPLVGRANVWVPLSFTEKQRTDRTNGWLWTLARLRQGVAPEYAQQAMSAVARRLEKEYPNTNANIDVLVGTLASEIGKYVSKQAVYTGFVVGICILLIGCSNIASIYLARAVARRKEMVLRLALGAKRGRLIRQLLSENILLLPFAVGLGLLLASLGGSWVTNSISYEIRGYLPNYGRVYVEWSTAIYAVIVAIVSVLLFSLVPILETRRLTLTSVMKENTGGSTSGGLGNQLRKTLVVGEVILALTVLVPAGLAAKSLTNRFHEDPGFISENVLTVQMELPEKKYSDRTQIYRFYDQVLESLRVVPDVQAAGAAQFIPFGHSSATTEFLIEGRPELAPGEFPKTQFTSATPGYFSAMGLHLVNGRFVGDQDSADSASTIVINDTLAQRYFPAGDAVGHKVRLGRLGVWRTIVGVVKGVKMTTLGDEPECQTYLPFAQSTSRAMTIVLRTVGNPLAKASTLRKAVQSVDRDQPVSGLETLIQRITEREAASRIFAEFCGYFGLFAMFLAAVGIYGAMAYLVESRMREIGIRMACGATPKNILWLVLGSSVRLTLLGVTAGLVTAWTVARLMKGLLFGVTANDYSTYGASVVVLSVTVLLASAVPILRAIRVDPIVVLRYE